MAFWRLFLLGRQGPWTHSWVEAFQKIFALHLLVLSGTQLNSVKAFWRFVSSSFPSKFRSAWELIFCSLNLYFWLREAHWPAPLVRAFFLFGVTSIFDRMHESFRLLLAFLLHCLFFPEQILTQSFFLSWACFFILWLSMKFQKRAPLLLAHLLCFLLSLLYFGSQSIPFLSLLMLLAFNLLLLLAFEYALSPVSSLILGLSFLKWVLGIDAWIFDTFQGYILKGATQVILVVMGLFRYIYRYDL